MMKGGLPLPRHHTKDIDIVMYLHHAGADINIKTKNGDTAMMLAAYCRGSFRPSKGHEDTVKYLHQAGADINITNNDGDSALMLADKKFQEDIVKYLQEAGAKFPLEEQID